jgi:hypothetical protein
MAAMARIGDTRVGQLAQRAELKFRVSSNEHRLEVAAIEGLDARMHP